MNRMQWEQQIFESNLNPTARSVAHAIGSFGNWTETREVWPSLKAIADMSGTSRGNAAKYVNAMVEQGWLKPVRTLKNNVTVYELTRPEVVVVYGILAIKGRGRSINQVVVVSDNLDTGTDDQVVVDESQVVVDEHVRLSQMSDQVVVVYDTNIEEHTTKNIKEHRTTSPVASGESPVDIDTSLNLHTDESSLTYKYLESFDETSLNLEDQANYVDVLLTTTQRIRAAVSKRQEISLNRKDEEFWDKVYQLAVNDNWKPGCGGVATRINEAITQTIKERRIAG